jgi:hypothetical protein
MAFPASIGQRPAMICRPIALASLVGLSPACTSDPAVGPEGRADADPAGESAGPRDGAPGPAEPGADAIPDDGGAPGDPGPGADDADDPGADPDDGAAETGDAGPGDGSGSVPAPEGSSHAGFSPAATRYAIPDSGLPDGFFAATWQGGGRGWALLDLDGDGRPDLAQTSDPAASDARVLRDAAGPYWRVFRGGPDGFSPLAQRWSVPDSGLPDGFFAAFQTLDVRAWVTLDLTGDGRPELVQTADPARTGGFALRDGQGPYWRVWSSGANGFAPEATRWALPESGLGDGFFAAFMGWDTRHWGLHDLDGDGRPELVQTADPARPGGFAWRDAGGSFWRVWRASGARGFEGAAIRWALPESGLADGFFAATWHAAAPDTRFWTLRDLDGDGRADLAQTADPAVAGGVIWRDADGPFWRVFPGQAEGFGPPERLSVGDSGLSDGFFAAATASNPPSGPSRFWFLADLEADGRPELIQTADPARPGGFVHEDADGAFWRVFTLGDGGPPRRLPVPASGLSDGFFTAWWTDAPGGGERAWHLVDLDGDGRLDLVQTADPDRPGLIAPRDDAGAFWRVFRGR